MINKLKNYWEELDNEAQGNLVLLIFAIFISILLLINAARKIW